MSKRAVTAGWIPLMDYATRTGVSLSTLRRHIKANKILYKIECGRYLLFYNGSAETFDQDEPGIDFFQVNSDLKKAREEIAELKTLIAFYEEQLPKHALTN